MSQKYGSIRFTNCQLIRTDGIEQADFCIEANRISDQLERPDIIIDCKKLYISPGYIDLQLNGGWGFNFSSSDEDVNVAINEVSKQLVKRGVTSYCPTIITSSKETYRKILPKIKRKIGGQAYGANILGTHLEGPFISSKRKGAHPIELIQDQNRIDCIDQLIECYGSLENVSIITMAPELCDSSIYDQLRQLGIVVSMGHTNATLKEAEQALQNNCNLITHLFNAMPSFHHRDPGIIGCLTSYLKDNAIRCDVNNNDLVRTDRLTNGHANDSDHLDDKPTNSINRQLYYGVICDNVHTHEASLRFAYRANPTGFICVTDGVASMGLESNRKHMIGDLIIEIQGNRAIIAGTNTLCRSIVQLDQCVRNFRNATNCSIVEAVASATSRPAKAINIYPKKGSLDSKADADFLIMTEDLDILATFINGELVSINPEILSFSKDFDQLII